MYYITDRGKDYISKTVESGQDIPIFFPILEALASQGPLSKSGLSEYSGYSEDFIDVVLENNLLKWGLVGEMED
jgi:hypothetical protein